MIIETIFGFFIGFLEKAFDLIAFIEFPIDIITVLTPILAYGNAIVGFNIITLVFGSLAFWLTVRFTAGFALFVYHNIPFV